MQSGDWIRTQSHVSDEAGQCNLTLCNTNRMQWYFWMPSLCSTIYGLSWFSKHWARMSKVHWALWNKQKRSVKLINIYIYIYICLNHFLHTYQYISVSVPMWYIASSKFGICTMMTNVLCVHEWCQFASSLSDISPILISPIHCWLLFPYCAVIAPCCGTHAVLALLIFMCKHSHKKDQIIKTNWSISTKYTEKKITAWWRKTTNSRNNKCKEKGLDQTDNSLKHILSKYINEALNKNTSWPKTLKM